jgi:outer membrane protein
LEAGVKVNGLAVIAGWVLLASASAAMAETKIGFVNSDKVLREAAPAVRTQKRLEKEFEKREQDLQRIAADLKAMQDSLEKNGVTLSEADRKTKEREFNELNRDFQRRQREFREDLNQRRNEELASLLDKANKAVKQIAEAEKFDIIFQEAVYFNPRIDITDKVIKALADTK